MSAASDTKSGQKVSFPSQRKSSILHLSPNPSSFSKGSPSFEKPTQSNTAAVDAKIYSDAADFAPRLSDADLFQHYLEHTSGTLSHCQRDHGALRMGIPTLALQSKTVFHSLLALSAVCICCDMITKEQSPSVDAVYHILMTGYRLCNLASEQMRELISQPDSLKTEPLLASAMLLVPFSAASQQVNHWISSKSRTRESPKPLSSTPRNVIIMMRGIRTTLQALDCYDLSMPETMESGTDSSPPLLGFNISPALPLSRRHVMFPIVAETSQKAFDKLQERLDSLCYQSACYDGARCTNDQLTACAAALEILFAIRTDTFSPSSSSALRSRSMESSIKMLFEPPSVSIRQVGPWLRSWARGHTASLPTEPLTMRFLGFLVQAPQAYLDLVLPLLDQRLESPINTPYEDTWPQLTMEQALVLDIYAHWSVLMFLVEEESWWIGNLPIVTLTGMVNRYGDQFVTELWPDSIRDGEWWPGCMLNILREIKRCR